MGSVTTSRCVSSAVPSTLARWSSLGLLEPMRATTELAVSAVISPFLAARARAPRTVVLVPGLSAGPRSTLPLQAYLTGLGHDVVAPGWRRNIGSPSRVRDRWSELVVDRTERLGPLALVGWSIGGG